LAGFLLRSTCDLFRNDVMAKQRVIGPSTISDQLREVIDASGMTREAIAQAAGVDLSGISRFIAGERTLTLKTVDRIAAVLELRLCGGPDDGQ
jgi:plasmid maintenance system antidote protein VapI